MDDNTTARLVTIRHKVEIAIRALNGVFDDQFKGLPEHICDFRSGWAKSALEKSKDNLDGLLQEYDEIYSSMEANNE